MVPLDSLRLSGDGTVQRQESNLLDLPNEVLQHALYSIPTSILLPTRAVSHRFCNVIGKIIHQRLLRTLSLEDWKLIIECYHPSRMRSEKYNFCDYLGTPALDLHLAKWHTRDYPPGWLMNLFAKFRPTNLTPERSVTRLHLVEDIPGSRTTEEATASGRASEERVKRMVSLESQENFSQLIFSASMVQLGPAEGVFNALAEVTDKKTIRLFRRWLWQQAQNDAGRTVESKAGEKAISINSDQIIWVDDSTKAASLSIAVEEMRWRKNAPILISAGDDEAVTFSLELEELCISLLHLLLALERNLLHTDRDMGKAMIFGSFPTPNSTRQTDQAGQTEELT